MNSLIDLPVSAIADGLRAGSFSAVELTRAYLSSIAETDGGIGAYLTVTRDKALDKARAVDEALARGEAVSRLAGVPCALKDNFSTRGVRTTCASRMLETYIPPYDAAAWETLDRLGCVLLGKTNLDEFAMGSSGEHSAFFPMRNPRDPSLVPGGSSSGSAAAVAAREAAFALGSDTGGSVRLPAAYCGAVGLRPTYGAISRYGLIAFASSLDTVGVIARNVPDTAHVFYALRGIDPRDQTSRAAADDSLADGINPCVRGLKIAVLREDAGALTGAVETTYQGTIAALERLGATIAEYSLPALEHALSAYCVLTAAEAMSNLMLYDGVRLGRAGEGDTMQNAYRAARRYFGDEAMRRVMLGTYALGAEAKESYYQRAVRTRRMVAHDMNECLKDADVLLTPVYAGAIKKLGEEVDPVAMYQSDRFLVPAALAGLPALSLPGGMQLTGRAFGEPTIFRVGGALEREGCA